MSFGSSSLMKVAIITAAGASFGVAGALIYLLFKKNDPYQLENDFKVVQTSKHVVLEISVPREIVGALIGRLGSNIKKIQEETNTRITFRDDGIGDEDDSAARIAVIRGSEEDAKNAESKIHHFITNQPKIFVEEIYVPQKACGMIIGKNGENIRAMTKMSKARISIESSAGSGDSDPNSPRLVTLRGDPEALNHAKLLIKEKVIASEERFVKTKKGTNSKAMAGSLDKSQIRHQLALTAPPSLNTNGSEENSMQEHLVPSVDDGYIEVYISAVASISKFWVQIVGPRSVELDKMVETMTAFYSDKGNRKLFSVLDSPRDDAANQNGTESGECKKLHGIKIGDLLAAPFDHDESWYRVKVVEIQEDEYDSKQSTLVLFYVDFGDTCEFKLDRVCFLKQDYMRLPFQAIECCLAHVKPMNYVQWTESAVDCFEELCYVTQWKLVMAKPLSYTTIKENTIAIVELVDTSTPNDVNIGDELVKRGHAITSK